MNLPAPRAAAFLDRDGTIIDDVHYIANAELVVLRRGVGVSSQRLPIPPQFAKTVPRNAWAAPRKRVTGELSDVGRELFRLILDVASGRRTWAERWGLRNDRVLFNPAPVT